MAKLYLPTNGAIDGPWLLTATDLQSLHHLLEDINQKIGEAAEKQLLDEAQKEVTAGKYADVEQALAHRTKQQALLGGKEDKKVKYVDLRDDDGRSLSSDSLAELMRDIHLKDFAPTELEVKIQQLANTFTLTVRRRKSGLLRYDVTCYDKSSQHSIFYEIENWVDTHRPSKPRQWWIDFGVLIGLIALITFMLSLSNSTSNTGKQHSYAATHLVQLRTLLDSGLTSKNEAKAIELYLKYQLNHPIPSAAGKVVVRGGSTVWNYASLRLAGIAFLVMLVGFIQPKTTIGLGRHKQTVTRYETYIKFVFVIIPTIFVLNPLYEFINKLMGL